MEFGQISNYLSSLREKISNTLEESTHEDKFILASNVLTEISSHIPRLATDPKHSKDLEKLIKMLISSVESEESLDEKKEVCLNILRSVFTKSDFLKISKDPFGSHVLQTFLNCLTFFNQLDDKFDELLLHITNKIEEECLLELVYHTSGSHFLRTTLMCLVNEVDQSKNSAKNLDFENFQIKKEKLPEWRRRRLSDWTNVFRNDLKNVLQNTQASSTLCLLINLLKVTDQLGDNTLASIARETIPLVSEYRNSSYVLEACLSCGTNNEYTLIFNNLISKDLQKLSEDQFGNYVVQSFIDNQHFQTSHLEYMIQNVNLKVLLNSRSSSIVWKLSKACLDLFSCQEMFLKKVLEDLEIENKNNFWFVVSSSGNSQEEIFLKASGCSLLEYLVKFQKSIIKEELQSFKRFMTHAIENQKFLQVCCDVYFSRVLQNLFDVRMSTFQPKYIKKLFPTFQSNLLELSVDPNGCHVLHSFFTLLKSSDKVTLLSEMVEEYDKIKNRNFKFVKMINLTQFKANRKLFQKKLEKSESVRELFKDIIKS